MTMMMEKLYEVCQDNFFDDIQMTGDGLTCTVESFSERYRLEAAAADGGIELALSDSRELQVTPSVQQFLRAHRITEYPFRRTVRSEDEMQEALDQLQSAADDLFGFCRDLAEGRHTPESAEAALAGNAALRDTPRESSQLDCAAAAMMRRKNTFLHLSAGSNFQDLVLCSGYFPGIDLSPELFVHTGCSPDFYLDSPGKVFKDRYNTVTLEKEKEFERLIVPTEDIAPGRKEEAGRIILYRTEIASRNFPKMRLPLIYAVCRDDWFAGEFLVPNRIAADIVCHPAADSSPWLFRTLKILRARRFLSGPPTGPAEGSDEVLRKYPQLAGMAPELIPGTVIPGRLWPARGDMTVYEVR